MIICYLFQLLNAESLILLYRLSKEMEIFPQLIESRHQVSNTCLTFVYFKKKITINYTEYRALMTKNKIALRRKEKFQAALVICKRIFSCNIIKYTLLCKRYNLNMNIKHCIQYYSNEAFGYFFHNWNILYILPK